MGRSAPVGRRVPSPSVPSPVIPSPLIPDVPARPGRFPQITPLFWVLTVLAAGTGQAASDWLVGTGSGLPGIGLGGAVGIEVGLFALGLVLRFVVRRHVAAVYWFAVVGAGVFGTLVPDVAHFAIGIPSWVLPPVFAAVLAVDLLLWFRAERSLSIRTIRTRRREVPYWVAVLVAFALGTSVVDLVTLDWHVGLLTAAVVSLVLLVGPATLSTRSGGVPALPFWTAYLLTRPLGGSLSDWLVDGLGLGAGTVTFAGGVLVVVAVAASTRGASGRR